ncbi:hypothetical protein DYB34_001275 [Aphanomyces astaci]|uniref:Kinetochore protein Nuf2 N-terminal domain-containing protein n=2 Tax=Aphanomyces astaci TaxID=112090 RepID=A0A3R6YV74_APHAT|nr:hypothetical protein DYB34_001275 [Aphanomyces astaci]
MSIYSFPVLKMTGIIQFIRDSKLSISEEDIKNCDPAAVRRFFEAFFEVILDISKDDLTQPALSGLSALQHPNLHESSVPELAFFRTSKKLLEACGVDDFTWRDIQKPTLKRLRYLLSAIINFSKFKEERKVHFDQYLKTTVPSPSHVLRSLTYLDTLQDNLLRTKQQVEDENVALRRQLEELQSKQAAEAPALQVVIDECAAMEVDIGVLNTRQSVLQPEVKALKAQVAQLNDDIQSLNFTIVDAKKTIRSMEAKVVNSPARQKSEIVSIAQQMDEAKEEVNALDGRTAELDGIHDTVSKAVKFKKLLALLRLDVDMCRKLLSNGLIATVLNGLDVYPSNVRIQMDGIAILFQIVATTGTFPATHLQRMAYSVSTALLILRNSSAINYATDANLAAVGSFVSFATDASVEASALRSIHESVRVLHKQQRAFRVQCAARPSSMTFEFDDKQHSTADDATRHDVRG